MYQRNQPCIISLSLSIYIYIYIYAHIYIYIYTWFDIAMQLIIIITLIIMIIIGIAEDAQDTLVHGHDGVVAPAVLVHDGVYHYYYYH